MRTREEIRIVVRDWLGALGRPGWALMEVAPNSGRLPGIDITIHVSADLPWWKFMLPLPLNSTDAEVLEALDAALRSFLIELEKTMR